MFLHMASILDARGPADTEVSKRCVNGFTPRLMREFAFSIAGRRAQETDVLHANDTRCARSNQSGPVRFRRPPQSKTRQEQSSTGAICRASLRQSVNRVRGGSPLRQTRPALAGQVISGDALPRTSARCLSEGGRRGGVETVAVSSEAAERPVRCEPGMDARSTRVAARLNTPMLIAAALTIPTVAISEAHPGGW